MYKNILALTLYADKYLKYKYDENVLIKQIKQNHTENS
jgi:hypothetical protein